MSIWVQKLTDIFIYIIIDFVCSIATRTYVNSLDFGRTNERSFFFSTKKEPFELGVIFGGAFVSDALPKKLSWQSLKNFDAKLNRPISSLAYFASFVLTNWFFPNFGKAVLPPTSETNHKLGMDRYKE